MPTLLATCAPSDIPLPPSPGKRKTPVHLGLETDDSMASQRPFLGDTIELVQTRSESLLEIHTRLDVSCSSVVRNGLDSTGMPSSSRHPSRIFRRLSMAIIVGSGPAGHSEVNLYWVLSADRI